LGITKLQKTQAEKSQWRAAQDDANQIRLVAGPGTGKSSTIERRVAYLLNRNANPKRVFTISFTRAIVNFTEVYPAATTHVLTDCFRCTPAVLNAASKLIQFNPNRIPKQSHSLYEQSAPPVGGRLFVWSFQTAQAEATAIASSCEDL